MKRINTIFLLAILLVMGIGSAKAQQVVDVCAGDDIVELHLGNYQYGLVQWQVSDDNEFWMDIDGAIDTVYRFMPERARYYRAKVRFPNCAENDYLSQVSYVQVPPEAKAGVDFDIPAGTVYRLRGNAIDAAVGQWNVIEGTGFELQDPSDPNSGFIGEEGTYKLTWTLTNSCGSSTDTVTLNCMKVEYNSNLVVVDETDEILSDSTMLVNGDYVIRFADPVPNIDTASILIGYRDDSFLRRVVSFEKEGDVFYLKTEQGYLNDVIKSGAFCFNILPSEPGDKSSSVKYLDHYPTRKELAEDPFLLRDGSIYVIQRSHDIEEDKDDIEISVTIDDSSIQLGADVNMGLLDDELEGLMYEHTISLTPSFDADIVFDDFGHLSRFYMGFYDAQFEVTRRFHIDHEMTSVGFKKSGKFNKKPKIVTGFMVGVLPVIVKLDWPYTVELSLALNGLEMTCTRTTTFTCAVEYNPLNDSFEEILEKDEPVETIEWGDLNGTLELDFKAGPKFTFLIAGIFGPYVNVTGRVAPSLCVSMLQPFDISTRLRLGLDLSLGCKFQLFSELFSTERSWTFHIIDHTESSPKSVLKRGGDHQVYSFGNYLPQPISVDVKGLFGMNMKFANVRFEPQNGGEVSQSIVASGLDGVASTLWKPGLPYGHDRLKVRVFDCEGNPVAGTPLTFHAYSSATDPCIESTLAVEAYHVNENSIIPLVTGGVPPYLYSLDDESYSIQQPTIVTSPGQNYTFYVRDAIGCEAMTTYNVPFYDCTNSTLQLTANVYGNTIMASALGGISPYWYSIDGVNFQPMGTFTHLFDGDYTVYVRDALGCVETKQVTINQPGHIYVEISNIENNHGTAFAYPLDTETLYDKGVCWSTHHEPTVNDFSTSYGPAIEQFPFEITSLEPNVEYYVRAYAVDSSGTSYSREVVAQSQQGITEPYVIATKIEDVTLTSAIGTGSVFWDGGAEVTERGICWSLNPNPTINDNHASNGEGMGHFSVEITDLTPYATYYARAYAINRIGIAYASEVDFVAQPGGNLHAPQGAINGLFTVGEGQQVYFSQGNLQYRATTNTWRFANHQYDYIGSDNDAASPTYDGWIDIFAWGTSGYNHGAVCYQPWSHNDVPSDYYAYGDPGLDLGDQDGRADWGYNPISNGGNVAHAWRTLTMEEWRCLLYFRDTPSGIHFAKGKVNNVNGVLLIPDSWSTSTYPLNNPDDIYGSFNDNVISAAQWPVLEEAGVAFMPAAGGRSYYSVGSVGEFGYYWTSSHYLSDYATDMFFEDSYLGPGYANSHNSPRFYGRTVRLVSEGVPGSTGQLPQVTTMAVTEFTSSSAACGGIVMSDGGSAVTERGVCWSTDHNPTIGVGHVSVGSGSGAFTVSVTGLAEGTTYYVRAYAINSTGTSYGDEVCFTTLSGGGGEVPEGAINGLFSVAPGYQVYFSQGNLQYIGSATTPYWKFADHQWDYFGDNGQGGDSPNVDRDLFGWGTSGYDHGAVCYQPWCKSENESDYYAYGSVYYNLFDRTGKADWGYNAISNGGNQEHQWRTLSRNEWDYVINLRVTPSGARYAKASVGGVNGVVLLPDSWEISIYALENVNQAEVDYNGNEISVADWEMLEQNGAIFIPASGICYDNTIYAESLGGKYWSASVNTFSSWPDYFEFSSEEGYDFLGIGIWGDLRFEGVAVRLVQDVQGQVVPQPSYVPWDFSGEGVDYITEESVSFWGSLSDYGSCLILDKGACWSTSPQPTIEDDYVEGYLSFLDFSVEGSVSGLMPNTTYYLRVFVTDSVQTVYSEDIVFTTLSEGNHSPQVVTTEVTNVTSSSATCWFQVLDDGGSPIQGTGVCFSTHPLPTTDDELAEIPESGDHVGYLTGLMPNTTYYVRAYAFNVVDLGYGNELVFTTLPAGGDHEYVDLGLPSGTLWATCNVGANAPEEYGDYFAWGETQPKEIYDWSTYQYCMGSSNTFTKYCNYPNMGYNGYIDTLTILESGDDAATANWGNGWFTPTMPQWIEMYQNTTRIWMTKNGVNGCLFTASNGNSIFLPAAGNRIEDASNEVGSSGTYWSSWLGPEYPNTALDCFLDTDTCYVRLFNRSCGLTVRPVRSNSNPTSEVPEGAINGVFSVGVDEGINGHCNRLVYFSQGNLQYQASTNTWRFAENQWDYVGTQNPAFGAAPGGTVAGSDNNDISPTNAGWIDLFGWGTSGYNHGAVCYQPWSTSMNPGDYYAYGQVNNNLFDQTGQADWGYNAISNGGNQESSGWRTMTHDEWAYLLDERSTASGMRYAKAQVQEVNGVILLPDDWNESYYTLNNTNEGGATYNSNVVSEFQWSVLESYGAVFLPAAGDRIGGTACRPGSHGFYWTSSHGSDEMAFELFFEDSALINWIYEDYYYGFAVRLVQDAPNGSGSGNGGGGGGPH